MTCSTPRPGPYFVIVPHEDHEHSYAFETFGEALDFIWEAQEADPDFPGFIRHVGGSVA